MRITLSQFAYIRFGDGPNLANSQVTGYRLPTTEVPQETFIANFAAPYGQSWECLTVDGVNEEWSESGFPSLEGAIASRRVPGPFGAEALVLYNAPECEQRRTGKQGKLYRVLSMDRYFCWLTEVDLDGDDADGETYLENVASLNESLIGYLMRRQGVELAS